MIHSYSIIAEFSPSSSTSAYSFLYLSNTMAPLTTDTIRDVLEEDLKADLGDCFRVPLTVVKCLVPTKSPGSPQCGGVLGKEIILQIQAILDRPITYLEGDKVKILDAIDRLASHLVHPNKHGQTAKDEKVNELMKRYRNTMERHFEAKKNEGSITAVTESLQVLENSVVEEEPLAITPSSCTEITEITQTIEVGEVIYPVLPRTHTFTIEDIEDKEEVTVDSSDELHLLPRSNDTTSYSLANLSTPPPSKEPMLSNPISKPLPSNNLLLSLILQILQQLYVGFYSQIHAKWGQEPVENTSGQIKNESFTELKFFFGLRVATRSIPILLCIVLFGFYYQALGILGCLAFYALVSAGFVSLLRLNSPTSEVAV